MTDPVRLLSEGATDFERTLLDSAAGEMPSSAMSKKMLVGLSSAVALGTASTTTAYAASNSVSALSVLKWGAGGLAALALGWGGYVLSGSDAQTAPAEAPVKVSAPVPSEEEAQPAGLGDDASQGASPSDAPTDVAKASGPVEARSSGKASDDASIRLRQELALLDQARAALKAGNPDAALGRVQAYEAKFPRGALRQEATVLKVEALEARGSQGQADALAEDFLKKNPDSAHRTRLESSESKPSPSQKSPQSPSSPQSE